MKAPRILVTAPSSGSGKTLIACGIMQALVNRGLAVASFKCGPDYIDPMFHSRVIGTPSKNLDPFFTDADTMKYLFARSAEGRDISVIEGVMGFYDGIGMATSEGSTYEVSQRLECPTILVLNCRGASLSIVPMVKGFKEYRENHITGVILNNTSERMCQSLKKIIEDETGVKVIGYVPKVNDLVLESRHLGLCLPDEIDDLKRKLNDLADILEKSLDIDLLIELAGGAPAVKFEGPTVRKVGSARIALADDDAFCFTYEDNIRLLEECGAEIVRFSPVSDARLPTGIDGLILPGGYPELHADALSGNASMMRDIRVSLEDGMPCMAECGGFMYLHERMEDADGAMHSMVGFVKGDVTNRKKLNRFGYISLDAPKGTVLGGCAARAHEFHYWDSDNCGSDCKAVKASNGAEYDSMHCRDGLTIGFPHLYYYSDPKIAEKFVLRCMRYRQDRRSGCKCQV
ncbi:MAG: cobyrinate a,c-diamide synthase [Candidatus Methanomethylophilaceae archaeon]|nr:cobyrinate a,c-diamide synthase [Candidatus Methanomethylophilaceae archaeon]